MPHQLWPPNGHLAQWILDQFPPRYQGYGVDVGASDGVSINTTFHLEAVHHWTILSVEANPFFEPALYQRRARVEICACASEPGRAPFYIHPDNPESFSSLEPTKRKDLLPEGGIRYEKIEVPVETVDALLARWQFPQLDLLCIDTEGTELDVLKGCELMKWKPRVIVTECWDTSGPIDAYLMARGYAKVARNVHNDIFVKARAS